MSYWTYVKGVIEVDSIGRTQHEIEYIIKTILDHLPKVTGSEENMSVYINKMYGYNQSSFYNEFDEFIEMNPDLRQGYDGRDITKLQSRYLLTVEGSLRDRRYEQTFKEFMHWLVTLSKRLYVDNCVVIVKGYTEQGEEKKTVINPENLSENYEYPSWSNGGDGTPAWWEYLRWMEPRDSEGNVYGGKPDFPDGKCLNLMSKEELKAYWAEQMKWRGKKR